jgi:hypothetical protein
MATTRQSRYAWNATAGRYVDNRGRFVATKQVRGALDYALRQSGERMTALTERMRSGDLTVAAWQDAMRVEMKSAHLYASAAAAGGWNNMGPEEYGRVGARLRTQYAYLDRFASGLADGSIPADGRTLTRASMYAEAARGTYYAQDEALAASLGLDEERNALGASDHCEGCLRETARGWVRRGDLVPVGARTCLARCRCRIIRRRRPATRRTRARR